MLMQSYPFDFLPFWPAFATLVVLVFLLDLVLRALALWRAARANQTAWFIALLIFNTVGILPLVYLLFFAKEPLFGEGFTNRTSKAKTSRRPNSGSKK